MSPTLDTPIVPYAPSINALTAPLTDDLVARADALRIGVTSGPEGCRVVDAGIEHPGGLEAGRRIAEICMGGLGTVALSSVGGLWGTRVQVYSSAPVLACLASQYAGWSLNHGDGKGAFRALGSGPARALARKEPLFAELGYADRFDAASLVLEVHRVPPPEIVRKVAQDCGVAGSAVTFILTPTRSLAGVTQIVARVLEVALHKVHTLGFPLRQVVDGFGSAPLPPPGADFLVSMGRTNDAILFGGEVQLYVDCDDAEARSLAERLPSSASSDYGRPFADIFRDTGYDFYKIDPNLFAPARVTVSNLRSGASFAAGSIDESALRASFGDAA